MDRPLRGMTVVVTRPARQAGPLIESLQRDGAETIALPVIAIEPLVLDEVSRQRFAPDAYDWTIFTSANAVEQAVAQLARPRLTRVAAIGNATARSLAHHAIDVHAVPASGSTSEALLAMEEFRAVRGRQILIVRGAGGRDLLAHELGRRGARVEIAEVYARRPARVDAAALARFTDALQGPSPCVVMVTSVEVLDALLACLPPDVRPALVRCSLVVPGDRVAAAARDRGLTRLTVARSAEDAVMVDALRSDVPPRGGPATG